jgi:O6-methylguanine-DNA--protein-cysteine methyltransferase
MNFKNKVLKFVKKIPTGKFLTYKKVAQKIKNPENFDLKRYLLLY